MVEFYSTNTGSLPMKSLFCHTCSREDFFYPKIALCQNSCFIKKLLKDKNSPLLAITSLLIQPVTLIPF